MSITVQGCGSGRQWAQLDLSRFRWKEKAEANDRAGDMEGASSGFSFFCAMILNVYIRTDKMRYRKGDPLCLTISPPWRPKDPSSWRSSSAWVICDRAPLPP